MGELISQEAALEICGKAPEKLAWNLCVAIKRLPAVDPVRHARWVQDEDGNWICTSCGHPAIPHPILYDTHQCTTPYCPTAEP